MQRTVLISINTSWNIYHFRASLIAALKAKGYRVVSAAPRDAYTERLRAMVDQHYDLPMQNAGTSPLHDFILFCRYVRLLRQVKPAVMLTYTIKPNVYGSFAAHMLGVPVINNVSGLGTAFIRDNWLTQLVQLLYRLAFSRSACVFFQNPEDLALFEQKKLVPINRTQLIAGSGVDLDYFKPIAYEKPAAAPLSFVLIARMLWDKGVGEYVEAARRIKAQHPSIIFRLVGPLGVKNQTSIPEATVAGWQAEGVIEYLGERSDIREVIAAQDAVVLPSYREGMPRTLLEAAAMGKPLIATDVAGCRHAVEDGSNGFLCRLQDAQDLTRILQKFIALSPEQRAEMGRKSREKAEREFDEKVVIGAYLTKVEAHS